MKKKDIGTSVTERRHRISKNIEENMGSVISLTYMTKMGGTRLAFSMPMYRAVRVSALSVRGST